MDADKLLRDEIAAVLEAGEESVRSLERMAAEQDTDFEDVRLAQQALDRMRKEAAASSRQGRLSELGITYIAICASMATIQDEAEMQNQEVVDQLLHDPEETST